MNGREPSEAAKSRGQRFPAGLRHPGWTLSVAVTVCAVALPLAVAGYLWELYDYGMENPDPRRDAVGAWGSVVWIAPVACLLLPFWVRGPLHVPLVAAFSTAAVLALMASWQADFSAGNDCPDMCPMPRLGILAMGFLSFVLGLLATVAVWAWRSWRGRRPGTA